MFSDEVKTFTVNGFTLDWCGPDLILTTLVSAAREYDRLFKAYNVEETRTTAFWKLYEFLCGDANQQFNAVLVNEINVKDIVFGTRELGMITGARSNNLTFAVPGVYSLELVEDTASFEIKKASDNILLDEDHMRFCIIFYMPKDESWMTEIFEHKHIKTYGKGTGRLTGFEQGTIDTVNETMSDIPTYMPSVAEKTADALAKETLNLLYGIEVATEAVSMQSDEGPTKPSVRGKMDEYRDKIAQQQAAQTAGLIGGMGGMRGLIGKPPGVKP